MQRHLQGEWRNTCSAGTVDSAGSGFRVAYGRIGVMLCVLLL